MEPRTSVEYPSQSEGLGISSSCGTLAKMAPYPPSLIGTTIAIVSTTNQSRVSFTKAISAGALRPETAVKMATTRKAITRDTSTLTPIAAMTTAMP